jgi:dihydroorotate dehydrogenase (NAD+) catalytic subunit
MAKAVAAAGADALSLINTPFRYGYRHPAAKAYPGQCHGRPVRAGDPTGGGADGLAGVQAVSLPIIGMGGIMNADDAIEFILPGASAVAVGTGNFVNPRATVDIIHGIEAYCRSWR